MDAIRKYKSVEISTQQRGKLIVMLYEGAIKFLNVAVRKLDEGDFASKGVYIGKAQDIILELNNSLNMEIGGEVAENLRSIYNYLHRTLTMANIDRDREKILECVAMLEELLGGWAEVVQGGNSATAE